MSVRFEIVESYELAPFVPSLRALEGGIQYPIDDGADAFTIDHGAHYHPFFSELGTARFLLALDGQQVIGVIAGVWRPVMLDGREVPAVYLADFKLAPSARGRGVAPRMLWYAVRELFADQRLRGWRLIYGAAMRGERGDVMRSVRGAHPGHLMDVQAPLDLYFVDLQRLAALEPAGSPACAHEGLRVADLSPEQRRAPWVTTAGRKDLRLVSGQGVWALAHLTRGPGQWGQSLGHYLRECGEALVVEQPAAQACFALDRRLQAPRRWLAAQGITPGAVCTVHAMQVRRPGAPDLRACHAVHLATSTI